MTRNTQMKPGPPGTVGVLDRFFPPALPKPGYKGRAPRVRISASRSWGLVELVPNWPAQRRRQTPVVARAAYNTQPQPKTSPREWYQVVPVRPAPTGTWTVRKPSP